MLTAAARRLRALDLAHLDGVASRAELARMGIGPEQVAAHLAADRWRRIGLAIVLHNATLTREQAERAVLINCGPRAVWTSFTAAARWGLRGWSRPEIHVLAPAGTARPRIRGLVLHRTGDWSSTDLAPGPRLHRLAPALLLAAASSRSPRPGCGLLAAAVQQRLLVPADLRAAVADAPRVRHRRALLLAIGDIEQGADALSEIDFTRLCRRARLPAPIRQAVRIEPSGRRRYLDVEWTRADGSRVAAEIDGAAHMEQAQWTADALRQNEVVIGGTLVLRFPVAVVRHQPDTVVSQLRRVLL